VLQEEATMLWLEIFLTFGVKAKNFQFVGLIFFNQTNYTHAGALSDREQGLAFNFRFAKKTENTCARVKSHMGNGHPTFNRESL